MQLTQGFNRDRHSGFLSEASTGYTEGMYRGVPIQLPSPFSEAVVPYPRGVYRGISIKFVSVSLPSPIRACVALNYRGISYLRVHNVSH